MTRRLMLAAGLVVLAVAAVAAVAIAGPGASSLAPVPTANTRATGYSPATPLSAGLAQIVVAQGSNKLDGGTAAVPYYGYDGDSPSLVASTGGVLAKPAACASPLSAWHTRMTLSRWGEMVP